MNYILCIHKNPMIVYVLKLKSGKYYIGKTNNPKFRLDEHFNYEGSEWTKKYEPVDVLKLIPNCDQYDEYKYTIKYMQKYGIDNVRGGSFCELELSHDNITTIKKMLKGSSDRCYNCGSTDHFVKDCNKKRNRNRNNVSEKSINRCFRCHRKGHWINECYAKTYKTGEYIKENSYSNDEYDSDESIKRYYSGHDEEDFYYYEEI